MDKVQKKYTTDKVKAMFDKFDDLHYKVERMEEKMIRCLEKPSMIQSQPAQPGALILPPPQIEVMPPPRIEQPPSPDVPSANKQKKEGQKKREAMAQETVNKIYEAINTVQQFLLKEI